MNQAKINELKEIAEKDGATIMNPTVKTRTAVKSIFGAKNARVTRNGEIHINGTMPKTNKTGWYLLGFVGSSEVNERLWYPDGSLKKG